MNCSVANCAGQRATNSPIKGYCDRHVADPFAPPMKVTCECAPPEIERLYAFGLYAAQCRKCGSPIEGTLR